MGGGGGGGWGWGYGMRKRRGWEEGGRSDCGLFVDFEMNDVM